MFSLAWVMGGEENHIAKKLIPAHLLLALGSLISNFIMSWILYDNNGFIKAFHIILKDDISYVGPFVVNIFGVIMITGFFVCLWGIYQYRRYSLEYYSVFCHGIGLLFAILALRSILANLSSLETAQNYFYQNLIPYGEGVFFAALYLLYCKHVKRGKKDGCAV